MCAGHKTVAAVKLLMSRKKLPSPRGGRGELEEEKHWPDTVFRSGRIVHLEGAGRQYVTVTSKLGLKAAARVEIAASAAGQHC